MTTNNAMLVSLNVSSFDARRYDKKISREVADAHNAPEKIGRYNKFLIDPEAETFRAVKKAAQDAREYHYEHTLPWAQDGARILPAAEYFEYTTAMSEHKVRFAEAVRNFLADFPRLKANAKASMNGLYNEADYPPPHKLERRFDFDTVIFPLPASDDFRVALGETEVAYIRERITSEVESAFAEAQKDLWRRLHEAVKRMVERLADPEGRFTGTLVSNVRELVELLPRLNVTGDPALAAMVKQVESELALHGTETLRADKAVRAEVAEKAKAIAAQMAAYMGK